MMHIKPIIEIALGASIGALIAISVAGGIWIWVRFIVEPEKHSDFPLKVGTYLVLAEVALSAWRAFWRFRLA